MPNPDLILYNGKVYPRANRRHVVQAVAIWNGKITTLGSDSDMLRLRSRSVRLINLHQKTVVPGLSDSHIHLLGFGLFLRTLDLTQTRSVKDVQVAVERAARVKPRGSWIVGRGWDQEKLRERRFLEAKDLGRFESNPVYLRRICGHVAVANWMALSRAGIHNDTPNPPGGEIVRDLVTGRPTGLLKEKALEAVEDALPINEKEVRGSLEEAAHRLLQFGLTSLHCIIGNALELRALHVLKNEGRIHQSIYAILPVGLLNQAISLGMIPDRGNNGFRVGGVKVYLDGSLGARTAALVEPYSDEPGSLGMMRIREDELEAVAEKASGSGFQICMHAIGDRAVKTAVTTFARVAKTAAVRRLRHRIEHSSLTPPGVLAQMKRLGIVASVQPRFIYSDSWAIRRLGRRRVRFLYPFHSMLRAGLTLAAGSDAPIEDPNPFEGIWSAVTRPGLPTSERLTVEEAIAAYTSGPAKASFSETFQGALDLGKRADFAVLDRDPFECPPGQLRQVKVSQTIVGGIEVG